MNCLPILVCLSLAVMVSCEYLSMKYQTENYESALKAESQSTLRHFRPRYSYVDYSGDCCRNGNNNCGWARYYASYYYGSRYSRRGCYYYRPQSSVVYCGCVGEQQCSPTTVAVTTTTTTAAPTTTTAAPTTTTAAPTNTTTTTTTTTTAAPTTTATTRFCPAEASTAPTATTRLLNGLAIAGCDEFPGLVAIQIGGATVCTGVVTSGTTLSIPSNCAAFANGADVVAQDGTVIATGITATAGGVGGPVEVTLPTAVTSNSCPGIACVYSSTMASDILLDTCKVAAAGFSDNAGTSTPAFEYLDIPSLQPTDTCQALLSATDTSAVFDFTNTAITYNCFISPSGSTCAGDFGGPISCSLTTGEQVVIGQIENGDCTAGSAVGFYNLEAASVRVLATSRDQIQLG
ncbi:cell wall protein DAN4-like [Haliotis rufescens]|uniref:cell wall protein DAN4-like n=1 Tax=Haliotis rufescens TaxID=6454 RepID=UPI00201F4FE7|nr:cell wall protein DAN4-like [Haliotis rufescens]